MRGLLDKVSWLDMLSGKWGGLSYVTKRRPRLQKLVDFDYIFHDDLTIRNNLTNIACCRIISSKISIFRAAFLFWYRFDYKLL